MGFLSVVMADVPLTAETVATPLPAPSPLSRQARLAAIVQAIDAFGVAAERKASPGQLVPMLNGIRDQLAVHNTCEQRLAEFDAGTLHAMQEAHEQLVREIEVRVETLRRGGDGLAAHGLLLLWLYHTAYAPPSERKPEGRA